MKKLILAALVLFCFSKSVHAQNTTVTGTVTDAGAVVWANGTYTFNFSPLPSRPTGPYFNNGVPFTPVSLSGLLDGSGSFTQVVPSNTTISPSGTFWTVTYCPQASGTCQTSGNITITGGSQNISANFIPQALSVSAGANRAVYNLSEAVGNHVGDQIVLIGTGLMLCNTVSGGLCTAWVSSGGGGGGGVATSVFNTITVPVESSGGDVNITSDVGSVNVTANAGPVDLFAANSMLLDAVGGSLNLEADSGPIFQTASGEIDLESTGSNIGLTSDSGAVTISAGGHVAITQGDDGTPLQIADASAGGEGLNITSTAGTVSILAGTGAIEETAGTHITLEAQNGPINITADNGQLNLLAFNQLMSLQVIGNQMIIGADNNVSISSGTTLFLGAALAKLSFYGFGTGVLKQTVTGSRGGNVALANLLTALAALGLIVDSTTP
jgi:hypothetical protein